MYTVRIITVAEFRNEFRSLEEPVEVQRYGKVVGTWVPGGMNPVALLGTVQVDVADVEPVKLKMAEAQKIIDMQEDEIRQLKRTIAAQGKPVRIADPTFKAEYRPVPKPGKAK
jgi:hypothetical protein